jgi:hypothetical protein
VKVASDSVKVVSDSVKVTSDSVQVISDSVKVTFEIKRWKNNIQVKNDNHHNYIWLDL